MAEYITKEQALETQCEKCPMYNCILRCNPYNAVKNLPPANVVEHSKIDKAIDELKKEIEENHLNVIEYADGEWIVKDYVYGAIERFKRNIGE